MVNLHSKELTGITPDETITQTLLTIAGNIGVDVYPVVGGVGAVFCSGANEWFDTVYGCIWLKISIEVAGFNTLRNVPTKIPQTEDGMALLKNAYQDVLIRARNCGFIAPGRWTLPFIIGNQETMLSNISSKGYYIYSQPISSQDPTERKKRKATLCQICVKLAGAINSSEVIIYIDN